MVDRVLHMVRKLGGAKHSPELVEQAAEYYTAHGFNASVAYLTGEKGLAEGDARALTRQMEREVIRLNREVLLFYLVILFVFAFVLGVGLWSRSYLFSLIPGFFFVRALIRVIRFARNYRLKASEEI